MSKVVIFDGNNKAHAAYHAYRNLTNRGKPVSILFGVVSIIRAVIQMQKPDIVYFCWDDARHKERLKICPNYKGHRKDKDKVNANFDYEDFVRQREVVKKAIFQLGIPQVVGNGMEADDYIYWLTKKHQKKDTVTIVSSDKDFHQLLTHKNVRIWESRNRRLYHRKNLNDYFPYTPEETVDYLTLDGDTSDNIPGYKGMGKVNIRKFLDQFGSISSFLDDSSNSFSRIDRKTLLELYKINRMMIDLPLFYTKHIKGKHKLSYFRDNSQPNFNNKQFRDFCVHYRFNSFLEPTFVKPFQNLNNNTYGIF